MWFDEAIAKADKYYNYFQILVFFLTQLQLDCDRISSFSSENR